MVGNTENAWFSKKIAENGAFTGKLHDFRGFAGFQHLGASATENCCSICCYQIPLIWKGAIFLSPPLHLGVPPPFRRLRWQETRNFHGSLGKLLENGAYWQIARFSRFCGFPAISTSPTKYGSLGFPLPNGLLIKCAIHIKHAEGMRKLM